MRSLSTHTLTPTCTIPCTIPYTTSYRYFLLVAAHECYALETSLVGSIGVITSSFGAVDAIQRLGIERRVYTAGTKKSLMDAFRCVHVGVCMWVCAFGCVHVGVLSTHTHTHPHSHTHRPVTGEQEQLLHQLLDGVHQSFRSFVEQRRGDRIKVLVCRFAYHIGALCIMYSWMAMYNS